MESAKVLLNSLFFDPRRYDLAHVGRYKLNKKLSLRRRVVGREAAETIIATETLYQPETEVSNRSDSNKGQVLVAAGEVLVEKGQKVTREIAERLEQAGVNQLLVERATLEAETKSVVLLLGNGLRRIDWENLVRTKRLAVDVQGADGRVILRAGTVIGDEEIVILTKAADDDSLPERSIHIEERRQVKEVVLTRRYTQPREKHLTRDDIFSAVNYLLSLLEGLGKVDDIDHLGNRRLRSVGELLQNAFRIGLSRMERVVKERMTIQDVDVITPQALINIRPVVASIKEFFGSSQLSQFMDQTNPLAELCLLYTSPSPRDGATSRMPSSA